MFDWNPDKRLTTLQILHINQSPIFNEARDWDYWTEPLPDVPHAVKSSRINNGASVVRFERGHFRHVPRCQPDNLKPELTYTQPPPGTSEEEIQLGLKELHEDREYFLRTGKLPDRIALEQQRIEDERAHKKFKRDVARWLKAEQRWIDSMLKPMEAYARDARKDAVRIAQIAERDKREQEWREIRARRMAARERKREQLRQSASKRSITRARRVMNWQPPPDSYDRRPLIPPVEDLALPPRTQQG